MNGSRAMLTWRPSGITYFARDPLRSYFHEPQKNEIYFLNILTEQTLDVTQTSRYIRKCIRMDINKLISFFLNKCTCEPQHDKTNKRTCAPNEDSDQPWHPPSLTRVFYSLCAQWIAKDWSFLHADSEDSDQTGRMPRLTWVFAGRTGHFVGFVMLRLMYLIISQDKTEMTAPLFVLFFRFYDPVNTVLVMSSRSVNLSTLFLSKLLRG